MTKGKYFGIMITENKRGEKKMKFWIEFEGRCLIEAENELDAREAFFAGYGRRVADIREDYCAITNSGAEAENEE